mgnify:CR=1
MINKQVMMASPTKQESTKIHTDRFMFECKSTFCSNCFLTPLGTNNKAPVAKSNINPTNANKN